MEELFKKLSIPQINDVGYAVGMQELVQNINDNFAKVASLPFLKGDKGNSIEVVEEPIFKNTIKHELTDFGIALVFAIYGFEVMRLDDLISYTGELPIKDLYSWTSLKKVSTVSVFFDKVNGEKHLAVPFTFMDARKNNLQNYEDTKFRDMSTFVLGKGVKSGEKYKWMLNKEDYIPNLYYDEDEKRFCWAIGSTKTGIIAQGVEGKAGKDGHTINCWYCRGEVATDIMNGMEYVKVTELFNNDKALSAVSFIQLYKDGSFTAEYNALSRKLEEYDFVILESISGDGTTVDDILFGSVVMVDEKPYIQRNSKASLRQFVKSLSLYDMLVAINYPNGSESMLKGIFTMPFDENIQEGKDKRIPHAFWSPDSNNAYLGRVNLNEIYNSSTNAPNPNTTANDSSTLNILYNETTMRNANVSENLEVLGDAKVNNSVISKHNFNKEFDINGSQYVIVPSTNIKVNNFKSVSMIQTGSLNNTRTAKNINMTIDLPSLGIKTKVGEIICIDKIRHLIGNDTKSLDISLELTELNCNWDSSDNTSWGGRSYYDVDLFASSATFNENDSQAVYVGTTETPIKATIESRDYFANLQISVIRYDVAFDDENRPLNVRGFYKGMTGNRDSDLVLNSGMLLEGVTNIGTTIEEKQPLNDNDDISSVINCSITVSSIKTFTDVIIYFKPYSNSTTNDLFYLLNPKNTSTEFENVFWEQNNNSLKTLFNTSYYSCLRLRFKDEEGSGKLILSHLNDNGNKPCDLSDLSEIEEADKILYKDNTAETITIGTNEFTCTPKSNVLLSSFDYYTITNYYDIKYDGVCNARNSSMIKITQNIQVVNGNNVIIEYLNKDNEIKRVTCDVSFSSTGLDESLLKDEFTKGNPTIYWFELPHDYNTHYYNQSDRTIYGIQNTEEHSTITFYFFGTHLTNNSYTISTTEVESTLGIHNKYYHILKSNTGKFYTANTQSLGGLGITGATNVYSTKFNNFKWNIGTFNKSSVDYRSGIGCGKLLPFPKSQNDIQHSVLNNSSWYLTLSKSVSSTLFERVYTDFVFDTSNNVILSNNYVERLLPSNVMCYYLGDLYLNNEPILTNSATKFEIQEFTKPTTGEPVVPEEPVTNLDKPVLNSVNLIVQGTTPSGVKLSWTHVENADSYNIQVNLNSGSTKKITGFSLVRDENTITTDLDTNILNKNNIDIIKDLYGATFQVQAVNSRYSVTSEWSDPVGLTVN